MTEERITGYELSRHWFDWCFENPEKISPNHTALYFWIIEHCNRLGWKERFGLPTLHAMEAIGIKSKNTYHKAFRDLVDWGFIIVIEKSRNQNSANIISIPGVSKFKSARKSALDIAIIQHVSQHEDITCAGTDTIYKPINQETNKPINQETEEVETTSLSEMQASRTHDEIDYQKLVDFFNMETKGVFGEIRYPITDKRKKSIRARIREHGKEAFVDVIRKSMQSSFLKGDNSRGFTATFDWLIKPTNFEKTLSGNYDNKNNKNNENRRVDKDTDRLRELAERAAKAFSQ